MTPTNDATYQAVFEVPAMVRVTVTVTAAGQQLALVAAHDAIASANVGMAEIMSMSLDLAQNVELQRVPTTQPPQMSATPLGPLEAAGSVFSLHQFLGNSQDSEGLAQMMNRLPYGKAREMAELTLDATGPHGCSVVLDALGHVVLRVTAPRGGWEVESFDEAGALRERATWLTTRVEANRMLVNMLQNGAKRVHLVDFTDRQQGPVVRRVCE
jgi:hypothetical protein